MIIYIICWIVLGLIGISVIHFLDYKNDNHCDIKNFLLAICCGILSGPIICIIILLFALLPFLLSPLIIDSVFKWLNKVEFSLIVDSILFKWSNRVKWLNINIY